MAEQGSWDIPEEEEGKWDIPEEEGSWDIPEEKEEVDRDLFSTRTLKRMGQSVGVGLREHASGEQKLQKRTRGEAKPVGGKLAELRERARQMQDKKAADKRREQVQKVGEFWDNLPTEVEQGSSGIVEDALVSLAGSAPGMATTAVNKPAGTMMFFSQFYDQKDEELAKQGVDEETRHEAALIRAALGTASEQAGNLVEFKAIGNLFSKGASKLGLGKRIKKYLGAIFTGSAAETLDEGADAYANAAADVYAKNPDADITDLVSEYRKVISTPEFKEQRNQAMKTAAVAGAILPGVGVAVKAPVDAIIGEKADVKTETETETPTDTPAKEATPAGGSLDEEVGVKEPEADATAFNAGASKEDVSEAKKKAEDETAKEELRKQALEAKAMDAEQRQRKMEEEMAAYNRAQSEEDFQRKVQQEETMAAADRDRTDAFLQLTETDEGLLAATASVAHKLTRAESKEYHQVAKTLQDAQKAIATKEDSLKKLRSIQYDVQQIIAGVPTKGVDGKRGDLDPRTSIALNPRMQILTGRLGEMLQGQIVKLEMEARAKEQATLDKKQQVKEMAAYGERKQVSKAKLKHQDTKAAKGATGVLDKNTTLYQQQSKLKEKLAEKNQARQANLQKTIKDKQRSAVIEKQIEAKTTTRTEELKRKLAERESQRKAAELAARATKQMKLEDEPKATPKPVEKPPVSPSVDTSRLTPTQTIDPKKEYASEDSAKRAIRKMEDPLTHRPVERDGKWYVEEKPVKEWGQVKYSRVKDKAKKATEPSEETRKAQHKAVQSTVRHIQSKASSKALKTIVVAKQSELPEHIQKKIGEGDTIRAATDGKRVYMVSENITSEKEAIQAWMHEQVGHHGLESLFDAHDMDFKTFLDAAHNLLKRNKEYKDVAEQYKEELKGKSEEEQRRKIVSEVLARRAEKLNPLTRKSLYQKFRDFVNNWLRKRGIDVGLTTSDINQLLEQAKKYVMDGEVRNWLEFKEDDTTYKAWAEEVRKINPKAITWYENHQQLVKDTFGDDADIFNALLAFTSPMAKVPQNAAWAVQTYLWMNGKEKAPGGIFPNMVKGKVEQLKKGNRLKSDQVKVDEFLRGLMGDKNSTVNDRWMYRVFFGPSMLNKTTVSHEDVQSLDANWKVPENTAARHKLIQLSKELTQETGYKWTPNRLQAALWMKLALPAAGKDLSESYDYQNGLTEHTVAKWGGLTPIEYLKKKMGNTPTGQLSKQYGVTHDKVSLLEKQHLAALDSAGYASTKQVSGKKDLGRYIEQLHMSDYEHVLTIPTVEEFEAAVKDGSRVYLTEDGLAGYTLDKDGDIQKVFNNSDVPKRGTALLVDAIANGGKTLDCFEPYLPKFYSDLGFKETWRYKFDPEQSSEAWDIDVHGAYDVAGFELPAELIESWKDKHGRISKAKIRDSIGSFGDYQPGRYSDTGKQGTSDSYPDDIQSDRQTGIGEDTGNGREDQETPDRSDQDDVVKFSIKPKDVGLESNPTLFESIKNVASTLASEPRQWLRSAMDRMEADLADYLNVLRQAEKGKDLAPGMSGYKAMRMKAGLPAIMGTIFHEGKPVYDKAVHWVKVERDKTGGLLDPFKGLSKTDMEMVQTRLTAESVKELMAKKAGDPELVKKLYGQDADGNWIDPAAKTKELMDFTDEWVASNPSKWEEIQLHLRKYNKAILEFCREAGVVDPDYENIWERSNYIPLNRIHDVFNEGILDTRTPKGKGTDVQGVKRLKGGKGQLSMNNALENLMLNYSYMMDQALKNIAYKKVYGVFKGTPMIVRQKVNAAMAKKMHNVISMKVEGKTQYFSVADAEVFEALADMDNQAMSFAVLNMAKRALTWGVTLSPAFRVRNFIRDTNHTWVLKGSNNPLRYFEHVGSALKAGWDVWKDHPDMVELRSSGGAFTGDFYGADNPKSMKKVIKGTSKGKGRSILEAWERIGEAAENANRLALYRKLKKQGQSTYDAAFEARDLLDFGLHGKSKTIMGAIKYIPFLNARIQGLYKLAREANGDVRARLMQGMVWKGAMLAAASLALHFAYDDDDRYKALTRTDKWNSYHFWIGDQHFTVPKPFEIGAIFSSMPVQIWESVRDWSKGGSKDLYEFAKFTFGQTFSIMPGGALKEVVEQMTGWDMFYDAPIVPRRLEGVDAEEQYDEKSSETAKSIGKMAGWSPKRIDHAMKGMFGFAGQAAMTVLDTVFMPFRDDGPADPALTVNDMYWLPSALMRHPTSRYTKYEQVFYEMLAEADKAANTYRLYKNRGDKEGAREIRDERRDKIKLSKRLNRVNLKLRKLYKKETKIYNDPDMTGDEKRKEIDALIEERHEIVKQEIERVNR